MPTKLDRVLTSSGKRFRTQIPKLSPTPFFLLLLFLFVGSVFGRTGQNFLLCVTWVVTQAACNQCRKNLPVLTGECSRNKDFLIMKFRVCGLDMSCAFEIEAMVDISEQVKSSAFHPLKAF